MTEGARRCSSANILIVDDTPANLHVLFDMLKQRGFAPRPVPGGRLALQAMKIEPPDLVLLDITMPDMDGYEVCRSIKTNEKLKEIPVIFISALAETFDKVKAFSVGGVDYITKPFQVEEVYARIETQLEMRRLQMELKKNIQTLEERVQAQVKEISASQMATIFALAKLAESRDDETGKHLERVRTYCRRLAEHLSQNPAYSNAISSTMIDNIYKASPLHDIGKVAIPDHILLKPGKLNVDEFEVMKLHTLFGAHTLEAVTRQYPQNQMILIGIKIARSHHEWWDGSGYPDGLTGEAIPLSARIMALADVYDAVRSKRVYKPAVAHVEACEIINSSRGTHLDPAVVSAFGDLKGEFNDISEKMIDETEDWLKDIPEA